MSNDNCVKVAVRIRPLSDNELVNDDIYCINAIPESNQIVAGNDQGFSFDHVFGEETMQEQIYDQCVVDLIDAAFEGFNATILAYGQTGSGKTWTMGSSADFRITEATMGIIPRVILSLFDAVQEKEQEDSRSTFKISVQFLEIYGEEIKDLLDVTKTSKVTIRETMDGDVFISGAREELVSSSAQMMKALEDGSKHRITASTRMNQSSSRSHAIFTVFLEHTIHQLALIDGSVSQESHEDHEGKCDEQVNASSQKLPDCNAQELSQMVDSSPRPTAVQQGKNEVRKSKFHFVDLAGSERAKRTGAQGQQLKEGIDINKGLLALGNVISALGDEAKRGKVHVPYRDSRLTRILQDSLGGNSKTLFICCVSPAGANFYESLNALRYANRARNIKNKPIVNRDPTLVVIDELKGLVQGLAGELMCMRKKGLRLQRRNDGASDSHEEGEQIEAFTDAQLESLSAIATTQNLSGIAKIKPPMQASTSSSGSVSKIAGVSGYPAGSHSTTAFPSKTTRKPRVIMDEAGDRRVAMGGNHTAHTPISSAPSSAESSTTGMLSSLMKETASMKSRLTEAETEMRALTEKLKLARSQSSDLSERVVMIESEKEYFKMKWIESNPSNTEELSTQTFGNESSEMINAKSEAYIFNETNSGCTEKNMVIKHMSGYVREIEKLKGEVAELKASRSASLGFDMYSDGDGNSDGDLSVSVARVIAQTEQQLVQEAKKMRVALGEEKGGESDDEIMSDGDAGQRADKEEREYRIRQKMMQDEVLELGESIQLKEQLVSQLQRSQEQYVIMKAFYEEKLTLLVKEIEEKQHEREALLTELHNVQENSSELSAQKSAREARLHSNLRKKDAELAAMKKRQAELNKLSQVQSRYIKQVNKLESDIETMKRQRVSLTKTLTAEKKQHAAMLRLKTKEIDKLKRELTKYAGEVKKLGLAKDRAEGKAREAMREGNILRKRANDMMRSSHDVGTESRTSARTARKAMSRASAHGMNGTGKFISEDQLKVKKYIEKCVGEINGREKTAEELRRQCELQLALLSEKELLEAKYDACEKGAEGCSTIDEDSQPYNPIEIQNRLESMNVQLKMRNQRILDMQQKLAVVDQRHNDEKMLDILKRTSASSLTQAQDLIKLLFGMVVQSRRNVSLRQEALDVLSQKEQKLKEELDTTHARLAATEREHDRDLTKAMNAYEEKLQGLFNHSSVGQVVMAESGLSDNQIASRVKEGMLNENSGTWYTSEPQRRLSFGSARKSLGHGKDTRADATDDRKATKSAEAYKMLVTVTTEQCNNLKMHLMKKEQQNNDLTHKVIELEEARVQIQRELEERLNFIKFLEGERQLFREMADDLRAGMKSMGGSLGQSIVRQVREKALEKGNAITVHGQGMISHSLLLQEACEEEGDGTQYDDDDDDDTESVLHEFENLANEINRTGAVMASTDKAANKHVYDRLTNPTNYTGHMKNVFEKDLEKKRQRVQIIKRQERVPKKDALSGTGGPGEQQKELPKGQNADNDGNDGKYANFMADYLEDDDRVTVDNL